jgi:hypothetical protein
MSWITDDIRYEVTTFIMHLEASVPPKPTYNASEAPPQLPLLARDVVFELRT